MEDSVAICGLACRLPGSSNTPSALWDLIMKKGNSVGPVPASRFNVEAFYSPVEGRPGSIKMNQAYFLDADLMGFDCGFFEISPHEAESLDPQIRLLLECAWECLESAGVSLDSIATPSNRVGCYVGSFSSDYADLMSKDPEWAHSHSITGTGRAMLSNRISYAFDLHGPSMTIDTGCSASLVAFHTACRAIAGGECSSALVCGANLFILPDLVMTTFANQIMSPTAASHSFEANADGYGRGEGINCVYLKGLRQAMRDGDPIRAIVRGTACNSDGKTVGVALPSGSAQEMVIREAYSKAGLDFADTAFVECHGTGTPIGDPIEVQVVGNVFGKARLGREVFINSIKANIGHSEAASGLSSIIKVVQALEHSIVTPQAMFEKASPQIDLDGWNLRVPISPTAWPVGSIKRASVNNWGYGGTNVHAIIDAPLPGKPQKKFILEKQHPLNKERDSADHGKRPLLLSFSANDKIALGGFIEKVREIPGPVSGEDLLDIAYTLSKRSSFSNRAFVIAHANQTSLSSLISEDTLIKGVKRAGAPSVGFVFTGQGAQWPQMGQDLLEEFPSARRDLESMQDALSKLPDGPAWSLKDELLEPAATSQIHQASRSQTLSTALQIILVNILREWGVNANAVVGHSSGEIAAAYTAGAINASEAIIVAYYRGKCITEAIPHDFGGMMSVGLAPEDVAEYIEGNVSIACYNSPKNVTLSGPKTELADLEVKLKEQQVFTRMLKTGYGYHSKYILDAEDLYSAAITGKIKAQKPIPGLKILSTVSGTEANETYGSDSYWRRNLESPVKFTQALEYLLRSNSVQYLVEIGPHSALAGPIRQIRDSLGLSDAQIGYVSAFERQKPAFETLLGCTGRLWLTGYKVDFAAINSVKSNQHSVPEKGTLIVDFPTYSWNKTQHWSEGHTAKDWRFRRHERHDLIGSKVPGGNGMEVQWRNILRCKDIQWLTDHMFHNVPCMPAAGYLAMALEGMSQLLDAGGMVAKGYRVRNFGIRTGLFIPEDRDRNGIEIMLSMRQLPLNVFANSKNWWEFRVWSYSTQWTEHSNGIIGPETDTDFVKMDNFDEKWHRPLNIKRWHQQMSLHGLDFGEEFRGFTNIKHHALSRTTVGDGDARMTYNNMPHQSRYIYHPTAIDLCLQLIMLTFYFAPPYFNHIFVPVFIEDVYFAVPSTATELFSIVSQSNVPGRHRGGGAVQAFDRQTGELLMDFQSTIWESLEEDPTAYALRSKEVGTRQAPYLRSVWKPDLDRLGPGLRELFIPEEKDFSHLIADMERLTCLYSSLMLEFLARVGKPAKSFHVSYVEWLKLVVADPKAKDLPSKDADRKAEIDRLVARHENSCPDVTLMKRVYERFEPLIAGTVEPIEILVGEDDLLSRFYSDGLGCDELASILEEVTGLLVHKNTDMKILEIGAGTGGTTSPVLSVLGGIDGNEKRFSEYFYTDISLGFFENARERFKKWRGIEYKILDIERSPVDQGFEEGSYDVIFAGDVLHATKSMKQTMANVRRLLKPGGKLIMVEITNELLRLPFIMGILPGWWLGVDDGRTWSPTLLSSQWTSLLQSTGFSGIDIQVDDFANPKDQLYSVLVSTAVESTSVAQPEYPLNRSIIVVYREMDSTVRSTLERLKKHHAPREVDAYPITSKNTQPGDHVVVLAEITRPMLSNINSEEWDGLKHLIGNASSILWVTSGGHMEASSPEAAMINGFARCIRSETAGAVEFYTLDLDRTGLVPELAPSTILRCLQTMRDDESHEGAKDYELVERKGAIYLNRLVPDSRFEDEVTALLGLTSSQITSIWRPRSTAGWALNIRQPGSLETLGFIESDQNAMPMPAGWVEIQVEAAGLNWTDVLAAMGFNTYDDFDLGLECGGTVSKVGPDVVDLEVGDRVCAFGKAVFRSHYRTPQQLCKKLPANLTTQDAAGIVVVFSTVLYALRDVARATKDQSVLIHSAAGGLGLAAIQYCRSLGCEIFATVSTEEKKTYLTKHYSIPPENIFNSRDSSFYSGLMRRTDRKGVDIVLSSMSGDLLHYGWRCVKKFGYFLDLRKVDVVDGGNLEMKPFDGHRTFRSIDLADYAESRPADCGRLIEDVLMLFANGTLRPSRETKFFAIEQVQDSFRYLQAGKHIGKSVIKVDKSVDPALFQPGRRTFHIPGNGTVVLVGGLGGLGRTFSRYIVESGAKHITFISRSGRKPEDEKFIQLLEEMGCKIHAGKGDISSRADVEHVVKEVGIPVIGVVQGAMILEDQLFENMPLKSFQDVTSSKVHGTINLHEVLMDEPIKFFVLLSSASGIIGNQGQSNYSAGNSFLDSFARMRERMGLPVSVINLGAVADVGWVSNRPRIEAAIRAQKYFGIQELEFLRLLRLGIEGRLNSSFPFQGRDSYASVQIVTGLTAPKLDADTVLLGERALWVKDARFAAPMTTANKIKSENDSAPDSRDDSSAVQQALSAFEALRTPEVAEKLAAEDVIGRIGMGILAKLSIVLGSSLESLTTEKSPASLGLDSLVAVELRAWMRRSLSFDVEVHEILTAPSVGSLVAYIHDRKFAAAAAAAAAAVKDKDLSDRMVVGQMNGHAEVK